MTGLGSGPDSLWAHAAEGLGSNNWAVDGTMSAGGKPMLASDPHLAPKLPSLWYLAHLKAGDFEVMGATLPGAPAVVIGRNRHIAWGVTNVAADVQDLFQERLDATGTHAEFKGANEPLRLSTETILVKGGEPITLRVRASRHGPLVSDAINENNAEALGKAAPRLEPLAFRWTALDDDDPSIAAFLQLNEARNWTEFTRALSSFVVPSQNFVYADVDGHIGYYAPGRIPIRAAGDGSMPVPGWTGEFEWTGWIPFDRLPHSFDPPEHFIVTANHRPMPAGYPYHISLEYPEPYRAQRITDLLTAQPKHSVESFRRIQADTLSLHARALVPVLLARVGAVEGRSRDALDQVKRWNGDLGGESAAAAIFQVWFLDLAQAVVEDELGPKVTQTYVGRYSSVTRFLLETLRSADNAWCDRVTTTVKESCDQIVADSFQRAVAFLTERLGSDATRWRWDDLHRAVFPHQGLDTVPVLGWLLRRSIPNGGDFATVNVAPIDPGRLYDQREVTSYRQIFDLTSLDDNHFLDPTGQSGHILSRYYDESLADWQAVQPRRIHMSREEVERTAIGRLQLKPH
jgi:penicillin amidase